MQGISGNGMDKATKQYRQYIFKLNHKLARKAAKHGVDSAVDSGGVKAKGMLRAASRVSLFISFEIRYIYSVIML